MSSITVNDQIVSVLNSVNESTRILDGQGRFVGTFVPATKTHTTRQVFEHLKTLTQDPSQLADLDQHIQEFNRRDQDDALHRSLGR